jgi:hypothetical protein
MPLRAAQLYYKGFLIRQAWRSRDRVAQRLITEHWAPRGPLRRLLADVFDKVADWENYKRSSMQHSVLRTLMQDAHGGLIR